ncbi:MAG: hypothetical protein Q9195_005203 [Heterodermia aff. obscurata]
MATTPTRFSVHSHHININIGDSAIHLLVDDSTAVDNSTDPAKWPVIYKAVLIDGGKTTGKVPILECVKRIQASYTFAPSKTPGTLQFDAVMITHWDDDHWGGVQQLIRESIEETLKARSDLKTLVTTSDTEADIDNISNLYAAVTGFQIPIFKYGSGEPANIFQETPGKGAAAPVLPTVASGTLLTTLYVPYDTAATAKKGGLGPKASNTSAGGEKVQGSNVTFICNRGDNYMNGGSNTLGTLAFYNYKIGSAAIRKKGFKFFDLCNVVAWYGDYLGVEVFYGKSLPSGTSYTDITNPGKLIKAHGLSSNMGPRMYIVAGDQVIIGNTPLASAKTVAAPVTGVPGTKANFTPIGIRGRVNIVDEKKSGLGTRYSGIRSGSVNMNSPSIACLILSSKTLDPAAITAAEEGNSWRLWHYMAGDALWDVEGGIGNWLQRASPSTPTTTFMKLSHHGAAPSTPASVLDILQPNVIITPSGLSNSFGHPRPEILLYLHALQLTLKPRWMRVFGYIWPMWLITGEEHFSLKDFTKLPAGLTGTISDDQEVFVILLLNLYAKASLTDNPLVEYWKNLALIDPPPGTGTAKQKRQATKDFNTKTVVAMAAAFKDFWTNVCGQSSDDMTADRSTAPVKSLLAIMGGPSARLKEVRDKSTVLHEWQIKETETIVQLPPVNTLPTLPDPDEPPPNSGAKNKRKMDTITLRKTPLEQAKFQKIEVIGAQTQEDSECLGDAVSNASDLDGEGGYAAGLAIGDSGSETGNSEVTDFDDEEDFDEEMPEVQGVHTNLMLQQNATDGLSTNQVEGNAETANVLPIRPRPSEKMASVSSKQTTEKSVGAKLNIVSREAVPAPPTFSPFYLCGADYASFPPGDTKAFLAPNDFSNWIAALNNGYIVMANPWVQPTSSPTASIPPPPQPVPSNIHPGDEWFQRITNNGLGITQITFVGNIDTTLAVAKVARLDAQLSLQVPSQTSLGTFQTVKIAFSSDMSKTVSLGATTASSLPTLADAMMPDYGLLSLGLQNIDPTPLTVGQIVSCFGMDYLPSASAGGLILPGFDPISSLTVTLDTSPGNRSMLAFKPDLMYTTWLRLRFLIPTADFVTHFKSNFSFLGDLTISNTAIVGMKTAYCQSGFVGRQVSSQCALESHITLGTNFGSLDMSAWINFDYANTTFVIVFNSSATWSTIQSWLVSIIESSGASSPSLDPTGLLPNSSNVTFSVRQVTLTLGNPTSTSGYSVQGASIAFEVSVYNTIFSLTLSWPGPAVTAKLWTAIVPDVSQYALLPYIEPYSQYTPLNPDAVTGEINFTDFCGSSIQAPPLAMNLSPTFYELSLSASRDGNDDLSYRFDGKLKSLPLLSSPEVPKLILGDLDFTLAHSTSFGYDVSLITDVWLVPRDYPTTLASRLDIFIEYIDNGLTSSWKVTGTATNISFATIYNLFDADANDAVMDLMAPLKIPQLEVIWDYSSGNADLFVDGLLQVGPFALDLKYRYLHAPAQGHNAWTLTASMGSMTSGVYTLGRLFQKLGVDQTVLDALADVPFVANITIPAATPSGHSTPPVSLSISKEPDAETIFWLQVAITTSEGTLSFTFVQLQAARSAPPAGTPSTTPAGFKRVIRVMLDHLPTIPSVPVVGQIQEPVDSLEYVWVGDSTVDNSTSAAGLTLADVTLINSTMTPENQIPFKNSQSSLKSASPNSGATSNPYVLHAGHHFMAQSNGAVLLDHIFGTHSPSPTAPPTTSAMAVNQKTTSKATAKATPLTVSRVAASSSAASVTPTAITADSGSTKAALSKSIGPLTIQNIGLQTKNGYLYLLIDATVALGPIQLTIVGFGVGLPLSSFNLNALKNLAVTDFSVVLSGMSVYFNAPPVLISGVFIIDSTPTYEAYKGGLTVSMMPYSLLAFGEYQHTFASDLKSVFIFGRLDGPLFTLEFAEISGVEVGFGYNYNIRTPLASDVLNFPLVQGVTAQNNPMDTLTQFSNYVTVEQDSIWLAFGFKVDAIQVLSINAAAMVQFSSSDVKVAIVGIASASMPPHTSNRKEMFLYVELGIVAALDITGGSLTCKAQLTPNSFVLYPGKQHPNN